MERHSEATKEVESVFVEEDGTERKCTGTGMPEQMRFKDAEGVEHKIFMDIGTHEAAYQHFLNENWDELKKFPRYVGQKHAKTDEAGKAAKNEQKNDADASK